MSRKKRLTGATGCGANSGSGEGADGEADSGSTIMSKNRPDWTAVQPVQRLPFSSGRSASQAVCEHPIAEPQGIWVAFSSRPPASSRHESHRRPHEHHLSDIHLRDDRRETRTDHSHFAASHAADVVALQDIYFHFWPHWPTPGGESAAGPVPGRWRKRGSPLRGVSAFPSRRDRGGTAHSHRWGRDETGRKCAGVGEVAGGLAGDREEIDKRQASGHNRRP